jgi:iron complex outermembrane receptor protein
MIRAILTSVLLALCIQFNAQTKVSGVVKDQTTNETLPGASVLYAEGKGTVTDFDGNYTLELEPGDYTLTVSYVGMETITQQIKVGTKAIVLDFSMNSMMMSEVTVVADVAVGRRTPVAFTDISSIKIKEELGSRDIPLILNSTPGVYATQSGGGDGDARVNIRGFNQNNVAVMVDGIPMNDMENGWVYWSNWFGLDNVTSKMQVQRGLGASKLAVPAVGGNINILTMGMEDKFSVKINSEVGNNNNFRQGIGINSGKFGKGWGITAAFSHKVNEGWVNQLGSKQLFYFLKIQKQFEKHSFSASIMGSPQEHEQRLARKSLAFYDLDYALKQGVDTTGYSAAGVITDMGLRYNSEWGYLQRDRDNPDAPITKESARTNYYHKPIVNFKHFWTPNHRWALSNILYASFGNGGGTRLDNTISTADGLTNFQYIYDRNTKVIPPIPGQTFFPSYPYDLNYVDDTSQYKAWSYLQSSINNHVWYGLLSTFKFKINEEFELSGGFDGRYYKTNRYQVVYDLLGADYAIVDQQFQDQNIKEELNEANVVRRLNDKINYDITSYVKQSGLFFLLEYSKPRYTAFVNVTGSYHQYNRVDHFALRDSVTGAEKESGWKNFTGATIKGGFKYNITDQDNFYINAGFLSRAQNMANTFSSTTLSVFRDLKNEAITSAEVGYMHSSKTFKPSVNIYYTIWENRPNTGSKKDGTETVFYNIPGMKAIHKGIEFDAEYNPIKSLTFEGVLSFGDWRWASANKAYIYNEIGNVVLDSVDFDAKGVRVGDAAQFQTSFAVRYSPIKGLYFKPRITYFDNNYSQFDPESLKGDYAGRQSWKMPSYYMVDLGAGYSRKIKEKYTLGFRANVMNVLDAVFITDAQNNDVGSKFDASSAGVYYGQGLRWTFGITLGFN